MEIAFPYIHYMSNNPILFNKEYWNQRAAQFGHTGHSEPFYYCFDQQARLFAIQQTLKGINGQKKAALDFGCGSGDFIELLHSQYGFVLGYDISDAMVQQTKKRFNQLNIAITNNEEVLIAPNTGFDLVLTVTVLQVLSKDELSNTLKQLSQLLSPTGKIVSLESFASLEHRQKEPEKTVEADWFEALAQNNLRVVSTIGFYNPVLLPTLSWHLYNHNPLLRLLRLWKKYRFPQLIFTWSAKKLIRRHKDVLLVKDSSTKIYIIEKQTDKQ